MRVGYYASFIRTIFFIFWMFFLFGIVKKLYMCISIKKKKIIYRCVGGYTCIIYFFDTSINIVYALEILNYYLSIVRRIECFIVIKLNWLCRDLYFKDSLVFEMHVCISSKFCNTNNVNCTWYQHGSSGKLLKAVSCTRCTRKAISSSGDRLVSSCWYNPSIQQPRTMNRCSL